MSIGTPYKHFAARAGYDVVVIGSGIGGLVTAALLAEHGRLRVLVLERHYTAGGFTHTFRRPGFEWDVGVHYIGKVNEQGSVLRAVFDHLTSGELEWADMGDGYDTIAFGDERYPLPRGKAALRHMLVSRFPAEAQGIDRYFACVEAAVHRSSLFFGEKALPSFLSRAFGPALRYPFLRYARRSTADVISECVGDPRLRGVLTAQWGNYGLTPSQSSFGIHALVADHYFGGAAYPVGGASRIAETIIPKIERHGGAVLTRAEVQSILLEGTRAIGVRMADGREFRAECVVSDAGVAATFGARLRNSGFRRRISGFMVATITMGILRGFARILHLHSQWSSFRFPRRRIPISSAVIPASPPWTSSRWCPTNGFDLGRTAAGRSEAQSTRHSRHAWLSVCSKPRFAKSRRSRGRSTMRSCRHRCRRGTSLDTPMAKSTDLRIPLHGSTRVGCVPRRPLTVSFFAGRTSAAAAWRGPSRAACCRLARYSVRTCCPRS